MEKYKTVDEFINALNKEQKEQVTLLRTLITSTHPELKERIKWNSPSYILGNEDRITFSVRPKNPITIVLHMGATKPEDKKGAPIMDDPSGMIQWKSDIRGAIPFTDLDDIQAKKHQLANIIDSWLKIGPTA